MRKSLILGMVMATGLSLSACTTYDDYGYNRDNDRLERAATGAAIGAATGAAVGAVAGDVSVAEGAAAGAVAGGVIGAVTGGDRDWYRDSRGYCYYINSHGERVYDYDKRC